MASEQTRYQAGATDRNALQSATLLARELDPLIDEAHRAYGAALLQLAAALGTDLAPGAELPVPEGALTFSPASFDLEQETALALERRADLQLARLLVQGGAGRPAHRGGGLLSATRSDHFRPLHPSDQYPAGQLRFAPALGRHRFLGDRSRCLLHLAGAGQRPGQRRCSAPAIRARNQPAAIANPGAQRAARITQPNEQPASPGGPPRFARTGGRGRGKERGRGRKQLARRQRFAARLPHGRDRFADDPARFAERGLPTAGRAGGMGPGHRPLLSILRPADKRA